MYFTYTCIFYIHVFICKKESKLTCWNEIPRDLLRSGIGVIDWLLLEVSPSKSLNVSAMIAVSNWHKPGYRGTV